MVFLTASVSGTPVQVRVDDLDADEEGDLGMVRAATSLAPVIAGRGIGDPIVAGLLTMLLTVIVSVVARNLGGVVAATYAAVFGALVSVLVAAIAWKVGYDRQERDLGMLAALANNSPRVREFVLVCAAISPMIRVGLERRGTFTPATAS